MQPTIKHKINHLIKLHLRCNAYGEYTEISNLQYDNLTMAIMDLLEEEGWKNG